MTSEISSTLKIPTWLKHWWLCGNKSNFMFAENVNNQANSGGTTRTRFLNNNDSVADDDGANTSNLSLEDLATLLRGSADILENNAPRLSNIVNQAGQQG